MITELQSVLLEVIVSSETGLESDRNPNSAGAINEVNKFIRDAFGNPYISW